MKLAPLRAKLLRKLLTTEKRYESQSKMNKNKANFYVPFFDMKPISEVKESF